METRSKDRKRSLECTSRNTKKGVDTHSETDHCLSRGEQREQHKQGKGFRLPDLSTSRCKETNKRKLSEVRTEQTKEDLQPSTSSGRLN
jgi:hypothetical protein